MTPETVFAKSAKGIQEIETRAHKLGSRLRQALILVDGIKTVDELVADAGEMGEAYQAHLEELAKLGFLTDISSDEAVVVPSTTGPHKALGPASRPVEAAPATRPMEAAPAPKPAPPRPAPAPAAAKPAAPPAAVPAALKFAAAAQAPKAAPPAEAVEYNSPIKWRMQDLLVEAMGLDTGKVGVALNQCRNREELARWVDHAVAPIEAAAGRAKAKVFYKTAKKLIGG